MEFYTTTSTVRFPSGTKLALNHKQAIPRKHLLKPDVDGMVIAMEPLEFKADETIGLISVPLALKSQLVALEFEDDGASEVFAEQWLGAEITEAIGKRPDDAEPGEQFNPESGDFASAAKDQEQPKASDPASAAKDQEQLKASDPTSAAEDQEHPKASDPDPVPEAKPARKPAK
ncbi:MAG: hypothetical protein ACXWAT_12130 [Methylobacter sp.]